MQLFKHLSIVGFLGKITAGLGLGLLLTGLLACNNPNLTNGSLADSPRPQQHGGAVSREAGNE